MIQWKNFFLASIGAVLLRTVIFVYFGDYLEDNLAFVAPWNSFQRLRDGIALWRNEIGLYAGDFHSVPWVALLFWPLIDHPVITLIVFTMFDLTAGFLLSKFTFELLLFKKNDRAIQFASLAFMTYVLNPMSAGICAVFSLSSFVNLLLSAALYANFKGSILFDYVISTSLGHVFVSTILISLTAQLNVYYVVLLFATIHRSKNAADHSVGSILLRFAFAVVLYAANHLLVDAPSVFNGNVMFFMRVEDQQPNIGVFWYMFTQVFAHYRLFFLCVFQIFAFVYVWPLWSLMKNNPWALWFVYLQVIAIVSSYPTYGEFCAHLPLFFAFPEFQQFYSITYLIGTALLIAMTTSVVTLTQWLQSGSGNANFYFGSCCTYILALIALVRETLYAHLVLEDVVKNPESDPKTHRYFHDQPPTETVDEDVETYLKQQNMSLEDAQKFVEDRYRKYKTVEANMNERTTRLVANLPDFNRALEYISVCRQAQGKGKNEIEMLCKMEENSYQRFRITDLQNVILVLGCNTFAEFSLDEAEKLLKENVSGIEKTLDWQNYAKTWTLYAIRSPPAKSRSPTSTTSESMDGSTNELGDQTAELGGQSAAISNFQLSLVAPQPLAELDALNSLLTATLNQQPSYLLSDQIFGSQVRTFPYLNAAAQQPTTTRTAVQAAQQSLLDPLNVMNALNSYPNSQITSSLISSLMAAAAASANPTAPQHHIPTAQPAVPTQPTPSQFLLTPTVSSAAHSCSCPSQSAYFLQQLPHGSSNGAATNSATLLRQQRKRNAAQLRDDSPSTASRSKCPRYDDSYRQSSRSSGGIGLVTPPLQPRVQIPPHNATNHLMAAVARAQRQQPNNLIAPAGSSNVTAAIQQSFCVRCQGAIVPQTSQQPPAQQPQALSMFLQNAASSLAAGSATQSFSTTVNEPENPTFGSTCENHSAGYSCANCSTSNDETNTNSVDSTTAAAAAMAASLRNVTGNDNYTTAQYYAEQIQQMLVRHSQPTQQLINTIPENVLGLVQQPQTQHSIQQAASLIRPSTLLIPGYTQSTATQQMNRAIPTALTRTGSLNPNRLIGRADHQAIASQRAQQRITQTNYYNNFYANNSILLPNVTATGASQQPTPPQQQILTSGSAAPLISPDFNYLINQLPNAPNRLIMLPRPTANGANDFPALMFLNSTDHGAALLLNNPQDMAAVGHQMAVMHHAPEPQPVGASNDQIKRCTQIRNYVKDLDVPEQERERCTVCLMDFETGEDIRTLHCSHMFHIDCIDRWLNYNKKCPVCRVDMDKLPMLITDSETCIKMPERDHGRKQPGNQQSYSDPPTNDYEREALPSEIFNKQPCKVDDESQQPEMQSFFRPDFIIRMRNRNFPVCKRQLAKHSQYFARISHDGAYLEVRNNEPVDERLNEYSTNDENVVALMLLYVQKGGVVPDNLRNGTIAEIVDLAFMSRKWEINGLVRACEEQLIANLNEKNLIMPTPIQSKSF
ncbi:Phosphatidylinositol glycan anchor biosynthesis class U protein [Aphelenchoides besseyi]|nr:Phosphatidylinositol glycan anchor biosynthesis class U protein [Aphelenchoides besseyi]